MSAGTIAYLANKNGDYVGAVYDKNNFIEYYPFKSTLINIEKILSNYDSDITKIEKGNLEKSLEYINKFISKRMIIVIVTDLEGIENIDENILKKLALRHDVLIINISDSYMMGKTAYDMEDDTYIPLLLLNDKKLIELEKKVKDDLYKKCEKRFLKYRISMTNIDNSKEITMKVIELLERHRNANKH